jgi:lipid-A-disaccharide synthase-like uncharacterized protein
MLFALVGAMGLLAIEGSYAPQIVRLWQRKHAGDVSVLFPALNVFGRGCAALYAHHQDQSVFVAAFVIGIAMRATLLCQVVYYRFGVVWLNSSRTLRGRRADRALDALASASSGGLT